MEKDKNKKSRFLGVIIFVVAIIMAITISILMTVERHEPYEGESQIISYGNYHPSYYDRLRDEGNIIADSYDYLNNYLKDSEYKIINTYDEYAYLLEKIMSSNSFAYKEDVNVENINDRIKFDRDFFINNNLIVVEACSNSGVGINFYEEKGNFANLSINEWWHGTLAIQDYFVLVPASKNINSINVEYISEHDNSEYLYAIIAILLPVVVFVTFIIIIVKNIKKSKKQKTDKKKGFMYFFKPVIYALIIVACIFISFILYIASGIGTTAKPIIYLYPEIEQEVSVEVGYKDRLTCTYPKYNDGWNVLAKPNGDLVDLSTGRNLYALYWEGKDTNAKVEKDGFVVKGEDSIKFLEEKLEILGLNEREAEEFIVYWLPKLEANKYNYIRFETKEEIDENMPLIINPMPDTIIRIVMNFKGLDKPIKVENQKLITPERKGFTVVEWGGTEIK